MVFKVSWQGAQQKFADFGVRFAFRFQEIRILSVKDAIGVVLTYFEIVGAEIIVFT